MKNKIYLLLVFIIIATTACKDEEPLSYDENYTGLYFHYGLNVLDSLEYSFFTKEPDVKIGAIFMQINTMGKPSDIDRPIKIVQLNEGDSDAAQVGVHYVPFDYPELQEMNIVKAGTIRTNFVLLVLKHPSLETETVRLKLGIEDNEHFKKGIDKYTSYVVTITSQARKPPLWDTHWQMFFGKTWGTVKMKFAIEVTGITDWDTRIDLPLGYYLQGKCLNALLEYNNNNPGNPLREPDTGELVTFK